MGPKEGIPAISSAKWRACSWRRPDIADVDVIVPVYRSLNDTAACLYSILSATGVSRFDLVVVNDCSPEPEVTSFLRALSRRRLFHYVENSQNLGFTASVNIGMQLNPSRDKILLNSDTIVFKGWIDRILEHSRSDKTIGTITPLSNNATICSYPLPNVSNNYSLEAPLELINEVASIVNAGLQCDIPTGIGFCMYIRRECLREVGLFDVETFNRGYGEENDFCMRASAKGWRNIAIADVLVRHTGEVSFALDAATQQRSGYQALLRKHPRYEMLVQRYINRDPLRVARIRIDLARLKCRIGAAKIALAISHAHGGGIETHLRDLDTRLRSEHMTILMLAVSRADFSRFSLNLIDSPLYVPNLESVSSEDLKNYVLPTLIDFGLKVVHVHSLVGLSLNKAADILTHLNLLGVRQICTIHDYSPICPRNHLVDDGGDYCALPPYKTCNECIRNAQLPVDQSDITTYRRTYAQLLQKFHRVFAPSYDTAERLSKLLPEIKIEVRPHPELRQDQTLSKKASGTARRSSIKKPAVIRVALIGALGAHKGSRVTLNCASDARFRELPIKFRLIGYSDIDEKLKTQSVEITGKYFSTEDLSAHLSVYKPHLVFLPSIWPETYLYTLSTVFRHALYPVAFDIGAQAERIKSAGVGALIDFNKRHDPAYINNALLELMRNRTYDSGGAGNFVSMSAPESIGEYYAYVEAEPERLVKAVARTKVITFM